MPVIFLLEPIASTLVMIAKNQDVSCTPKSGGRLSSTVVHDRVQELGQPRSFFHSGVKMNRFAVFALLIAWAWLTMTLVHELGHVVVGCACGAKLGSIEIRPWCLPYSFFSPNPMPLLTLWGGPIIGCTLPLLVAWLSKRPAVWFVAWFCIVANGLYLLTGCYSNDSELDSVKMVKAGMSTPLLIFVSAAMSVLGYVGFRSECQRVLQKDQPEFMSRRVFATSCFALVLCVAIQSAIGVAVG